MPCRYAVGHLDLSRFSAYLLISDILLIRLPAHVTMSSVEYYKLDEIDSIIHFYLRTFALEFRLAGCKYRRPLLTSRHVTFL